MLAPGFYMKQWNGRKSGVRSVACQPRGHFTRIAEVDGPYDYQVTLNPLVRMIDSATCADGVEEDHVLNCLSEWGVEGRRSFHFKGTWLLVFS